VDELAYRFRHILIRDAAYESLPKGERARLHESLAGWLESVWGDRLAEVEEIVGYHQEQAVLYRRELAVDGDGGLAMRASGHLAAAATRAADRGDSLAAAGLFERAAALISDDEAAGDRLLLEGALALDGTAEEHRARPIIEGIVERAKVSGDTHLESHASVGRWIMGEKAGRDQEEIRRDARAAVEVLGASGEELGLARAWRLLGGAYWYMGEGAACEAATLQALDHARLSGRRSEVLVCYFDLTTVLNTGPTPVDAGIERCKAILALEGDDRIVGGWMAHALAHLQAKRGEFGAARANAAQTRRILEENGQLVDHAILSEVVADVEYQAGAMGDAKRILRDGLETIHRLGQKSSVLASHLGHVAWHDGDVDLAEATAEEGLSAGGWMRALTLGTLGRVRATQGRFDEAEALVREALAHWVTTDYLTYHGWGLEALADVVATAGRTGEAVAALEAARGLHARKGSTVAVAKVDARLAGLHSGG
jgi:tetratricopeptide (TPR) repeat protein